MATIRQAAARRPGGQNWVEKIEFHPRAQDFPLETFDPSAIRPKIFFCARNFDLAALSFRSQPFPISLRDEWGRHDAGEGDGSGEHRVGGHRGSAPIQAGRGHRLGAAKKGKS